MKIIHFLLNLWTRMKIILVFILWFAISSNARYLTPNYHQVDIETVGPKVRPGNYQKKICNSCLLSNFNLCSCENDTDGTALLFLWDQGNERKDFGSRLDELAGIVVLTFIFTLFEKFLFYRQDKFLRMIPQKWSN